MALGAIPSAQVYQAAFTAIKPRITEKQMRMLEFHYKAPGRRVTATQLAEKVGYKNHGGANLQYGLLAKRVRELVKFPQPRPGGDFDGDSLRAIVSFHSEEGSDLIFILRSEVAEALDALAWFKAKR